jgi:hypothetical protein
MLIELFNKGRHRCLMFCDMGARKDAVQTNQFLIVHGDTGAVIDPGGNLAYNDLYMGVSRQFPPQRLSAILASHADPDIIASLDRWMTATTAPVYISAIWERFVPHFCKPGKTAGRVVGIPDAGMRIPWAVRNCWRCPRTSCTPKATSSSGMPTAASCSRVTWGFRWAWTPRARSATWARTCRVHGGLSPALHGQQQDPAAVGHDGARPAHPHDRAAARLPAGGLGGAGLHRLGRRPGLRDRPDGVTRTRVHRIEAKFNDPCRPENPDGADPVDRGGLDQLRQVHGVRRHGAWDQLGNGHQRQVASTGRFASRDGVEHGLHLAGVGGWAAPHREAAFTRLATTGIDVHIDEDRRQAKRLASPCPGAGLRRRAAVADRMACPEQQAQRALFARAAPQIIGFAPA